MLHHCGKWFLAFIRPITAEQKVMAPALVSLRRFRSKQRVYSPGTDIMNDPVTGTLFVKVQEDEKKSSHSGSGKAVFPLLNM